MEGLFDTLLIQKEITFKRMSNRHVKGYEIYGLFPDENYTSGIRKVLLDYIKNPGHPNVDMSSKELEYNKNYTWKLPEDMFLDRDHKFKIFINNTIVNPLYFQYNKYSRLVTIDKNLKPIDINDKIRVDYFRDMITKTYSLDEDCTIQVVPIYADSYTYGNHNVII